jgi:hypothetical protein
MQVHLTEAQARRYGFIKGPKPAQTATARGPYHWRCACGAEGRTHRSADEHVAPGHNRFETVLDG